MMMIDLDYLIDATLVARAICLKAAAAISTQGV